MQENDDQKYSKPSGGNLSIKEVAAEASNLMPDEIQRQIMRGDETKGDADERDIVGNINSNETPQGREATKNNKSDGD